MVSCQPVWRDGRGVLKKKSQKHFSDGWKQSGLKRASGWEKKRNKQRVKKPKSCKVKMWEKAAVRFTL